MYRDLLSSFEKDVLVLKFIGKTENLIFHPLDPDPNELGSGAKMYNVHMRIWNTVKLSDFEILCDGKICQT